MYMIECKTAVKNKITKKKKKIEKKELLTAVLH